MRRFNQLQPFLLALIAGLAQSTSAIADQIYWADYDAGTIQRANLDGTGDQTLVAGLTGPIGLALDLPAGQMIFSNYPSNISRANLDGSNMQTLISGLPEPVHGIALDLAAGKLYFALPGVGEIRSANLDGTGMKVLVSGVNTPNGVALDLIAGKIYWTDYLGGDIRSANLNGTGMQTLLSGLNTPTGIALDTANHQLYWTSNHGFEVFRANFNGTGQQALLSSPSYLTDLALQLSAGKMYIGVGTDDAGHSGEILSANLDGSNLRTFLAFTTYRGYPTGLSIAASVPEPSSWLLLSLGLVTVVALGRRRPAKKKAVAAA